MNFSEMPVEVWADMLEEEGEDTTKLREWIASGLKSNDGYDVMYNGLHDCCNTYFGDSLDSGNGDGDSDGYNHKDPSNFYYAGAGCGHAYDSFIYSFYNYNGIDGDYGDAKTDPQDN